MCRVGQLACAVVAIGVAVGCDAPGKGTYGSVSAPSSTTALTAAISPVVGVFGTPCVANIVNDTAFNLTINAFATIDLNQVTLRLNDGTTLGGPSVTFPADSLRAQLTTTRFNAGSSRTVVLQPFFGCSFVTAPFLFADLLFIDGAGGAQTLTVSTVLR
jgi:hypothetical protein